MKSVEISYEGLSKEILSVEEISNLFDGLWGRDSRGFPTFPAVIGGISGFWQDEKGKQTSVSDLNELLEAYRKELTAIIHISGSVNHAPRCSILYIPSRREMSAKITADTLENAETKRELIEAVCPIQEKPIVFVSYDSQEIPLADFVRDFLMRVTGNKLEPFVAKRDIPSGGHPYKIMMDEKLKHAQAIISICSVRSKTSSWVLWESASIWARDYKIHPLFTNISPSDFGPPLNLVCQGNGFFAKQEFIHAITTICADLGIVLKDVDFTQVETTRYEGLREKFSVLPPPEIEELSKVSSGFEKLITKADFHRYSFVFEVENQSRKKFDDIVVEIDFPILYLEKKAWAYPHLRSSTSKEKPEYIHIEFSFSGLDHERKSQLAAGLLPGKKLKIFGSDGVANLIYEMDHDRWGERNKYTISWKVYINGGVPQEGSIPLNSVQYF